MEAYEKVGDKSCGGKVYSSRKKMKSTGQMVLSPTTLRVMSSLRRLSRHTVSDLKTSRSLPVDSGLCFDIFEQVITFLPVKSLLRFRSVSRQVRDLIASDTFVKLHLRHTISSNASVKQIYWPRHKLFPHSISIPTCDFSSFDRIKLARICCDNFLPNPTKAQFILGSCNGLLLVAMVKDTFIWNPSTRNYMKLFPSSNWHLHMDNLNIFETIITGLGYDALLDEYKGVVYLNVQNDKRKLFVCTSRTGHWKETECSLDFSNLICECRRGITLNGYLNWIVQNLNHQSRVILLRFDITKEKFETFSTCIRVSYGQDRYPALGMLGGGGCLCATTHDYGDETRGVWVMKESGENKSWSKLFTIRGSSIKIGDLIPLFINNENELIFLDYAGTLLAYYPNTQKLIPRTRNSWCLAFNCFNYVGYVESLVSPRR